VKLHLDSGGDTEILAEQHSINEQQITGNS